MLDERGGGHEAALAQLGNALATRLGVVVERREAHERQAHEAVVADGFGELQAAPVGCAGLARVFKVFVVGNEIVVRGRGEFRRIRFERQLQRQPPHVHGIGVLVLTAHAGGLVEPHECQAAWSVLSRLQGLLEGRIVMFAAKTACHRLVGESRHPALALTAREPFVGGPPELALGWSKFALPWLYQKYPKRVAAQPWKWNVRDPSSATRAATCWSPPAS